ncbi:hypothetical protein BU24DRAFT_457459 [Aaosphaeria arxii CBS 175.79]|uniref:Extracellular membrane protein CFEM domain-containing protein n=1 Tax=Aaosphaeria arxii CBS 175.79 TaxID=1450172 RepID=A0A6A5Y9J3_9PLEO|nr:uncharacterized protein BU24DRAFT_457459 [Aaosphaeria arxii CBS 175.79]KAF2021480.1 hypothetical protein BU24DRAFT_457459 [Aaosphaeria arxii CBS 175.79]
MAIAQVEVGSITQDVTNMPAFPSQKACARSCFVNTGFCPNDILGSAISCAEHTDCNSMNWQAKNDCYCRQDLQKPAQDILSSCVSTKCNIGDVAIDAASAGSIYANYCSQKGYPYVPPATPNANRASTTGAGFATRTTGTLGLGPTGSSSSSSGSSSSSNKLSITTIIGIVIGSIVGLILLAFFIRYMIRWCTPTPKPPPLQPYNPPPVHPITQFPGPYHSPPSTIAHMPEVTPEDSRSMLSGTVEHNTVLSGFQPQRFQHQY